MNSVKAFISSKLWARKDGMDRAVIGMTTWREHLDDLEVAIRTAADDAARTEALRVLAKWVTPPPFFEAGEKEELESALKIAQAAEGEDGSKE